MRRSEQHACSGRHNVHALPRQFALQVVESTHLLVTQFSSTCRPFHHRVPAVRQRYGVRWPWSHRKAVPSLPHARHPWPMLVPLHATPLPSSSAQDSPTTLTCHVRAHFMDWAERHHPTIIDVKSGPRVSLAKHAEYKYLLHVRRPAGPRASGVCDL